MSDYDTLEKCKTIQSLLAKRQAELARSGMSKSRAFHRAADEIAPTLSPPLQGQELETKIATIICAYAREKKHGAVQKSIAVSSSPVGIPNLLPEILDDAIVSGKNKERNVAKSLAGMEHGTMRILVPDPFELGELELLQQGIGRATESLGWERVNGEPPYTTARIPAMKNGVEGFILKVIRR